VAIENEGSGAHAVRIIRTLKEYNRELPVDFLFHVAGKNEVDFNAAIKGLEQKGLIEMKAGGARLALKKTPIDF